MNAFVNAISQPNMVRTDNGMPALDKTGDKLVDFFFKAGASRNSQTLPQEFVAALNEDKSLGMKLLFWLRDVRGGAGERDSFRRCLVALQNVDPELLNKNLHLIPFYGRWDDGIVLRGYLANLYMEMWGSAINNGDGLAAKWAPRKGGLAAHLRATMGLTPKQYRHLIVGHSKTVEQQMCAKNWDAINFSHVPSVAASRYRKAFSKNALASYSAYLEALKNGDAGVKMNASAIFPHDAIMPLIKKTVASYGGALSDQEIAAAVAQWNALPNYVGDKSVLALVDVSGSMNCAVGGKGSTNCIDVALALGLYVADKMTGAFKDTFMTFSTSPELLTLKGDIMAKLSQMNTSSWDMSTNIVSAMNLILATAVKAQAPQEDMPAILLILSDMQFDSCVDDVCMLDYARVAYAKAGYTMPKIVFWNLKAHSNVPAGAREDGVALVSGFSPSVLTAAMSAKNLNPFEVMLDTLSNDRYSNIVV